MNHFNNQHGFTLLEVLIAVTITAVIGVGASQLLISGADTKQSLAVRSAEIKNLQRMDLFMRKDFSQIAGRQANDIYGNLSLAVTSEGDNLIEFSYSGVPAEPFNPDKKQSNMLRAAYAMRPLDHEYCDDAERPPYNEGQAANNDANCFVRVFWPVLDVTTNTQPIIQVLLDNITEASFQFRGLLLDLQNDENSIRSNDWQDDWPPPSMSQGLLADLVQIKFKLTTKSYGNIERIFEVPRYAFK
ncbi:MAG: general secretion pathway protein J [Bermanella sp.]|jgi:general secretion pathway protein J